MELQDYLRLLRKRWIGIGLITVLALAAAAGFSLTQTPQYEAKSQIFVSVQGGTTASDLAQGSTFTQRQVTSYASMATSPRVLQPVIEELALDLRTQELAPLVRASIPLNTSLIDIIVTHENPAIAAAISNVLADHFAEVVTEFERPNDGGASPVKISKVRDAHAPASPASPNLKLNLALGLLLGLGAGVAYAVLREVLDTRVRNEAHVTALSDVAIVGRVGFSEEVPEHPLIVKDSPFSPQAESYRRLRTNLQFLDLEEGGRSVLVTSSLPNEGKSTTVTNLALALADTGASVLLVDADLRRPSVAGLFALEGNAGLTTILIGQAELEDVVQPWAEGKLHILTAGTVPPNPSELLGTKRMGEFLAHATTTYDWVLFDTPPLLPVTDAAVLSKHVGGSLVVIGADSVHRQEFTNAIEGLHSVGARVMGLVLNRVKVDGRGRGGKYGYGYAPTTQASSTDAAVEAKPA